MEEVMEMRGQLPVIGYRLSVGSPEPVSGSPRSAFRLPPSAFAKATADKSAFTLVELMTVIAIIGILAGLIIGIAGYATRKADRGKAISDMEHIRNALEEYRLQNGSYPAGNGEMTSVSAPFPAVRTALNNLAMSNSNTSLQFEDPWGNGYWYGWESAFSYRLWSFGPDRLDTNDNIDIGTSGL